MTFFAFGVNHETTSIRVREQMAMSASQLADVYRRVMPSECECVIISTCNRTEAYLYGDSSDVVRLRTAMEDVAGTAWPDGSDFEYRDEEAVLHVLRVVVGLKSLVLGDGQIFGQMKDAYRLAVDEDAVGTSMHRLMHTAFRAAKRVIGETLLTCGNASVSGAAVAVAREFFYRRDGGGLDARHALVLGGGQMGTLALEALAGASLASVSIANRTRARAEKIAGSDGVRVVDWSSRYEALAASDLVIVTTGAGSFVVAADRLPARDRPLLIVDASVPRNVDPAVADIDGYEIIDLDALNRLLVDAEKTRREAVPAAEAICVEHLEEFVAWVLHHQSMQPAIQSIMATFDEIRRQEIDRHAHRFGDLDRLQLDRLTRSIMQKLLAVPIVRLKSADPESIDFVQGVELLRYLFSRPGCDETSSATHADLDRDAVLSRLLALDFSFDDTSDGASR